MATVLPSQDKDVVDQNVQYLDTTMAYDLWSEVYDTDGNFLQKLDTLEMKTLLPQFLSRITSKKPWKLVDLGCGTGRNTTALLHVPQSKVIALDASPKMLDVARSRLSSLSENVDKTAGDPVVVLDVYDILKSENIPPSSRNANGVISTLVIEHVPLEPFFEAVAQMLKFGDMLLVTNMHSEMGQISQAGFVDPKTGVKIRPKSYAHTIPQLIAAARVEGFEVDGPVLEKSVDDALSNQLGSRSKKWIGVTVWFGVMFRKNR